MTHKYGPNGHIVDAFLVHLRGMSIDDWDKVDAEWNAAGFAEWPAALEAAKSAAGSAASESAASEAAAWSAAWSAAGYAARSAAGPAAWWAAWWAAESAALEIRGADLLRKRGQQFFFLPMFGFADERAVLAALQPEEVDGPLP